MEDGKVILKKIIIKEDEKPENMIKESSPQPQIPEEVKSHL